MGKKTPSRLPFVRIAAGWLVVLFIWITLISGGIVIYLAYDLPDVKKALFENRRPFITVLAHDGRPFGNFGEMRRTSLEVSDLPIRLKEAIISTEDRRFYSHFGIDVIGVARAILANIKAGKIVQGGSTITQQAAKNLFLSPDRTFKRKVQEILLSIWLEQNFSKDQILSIYLNRVYFGAGCFGVEAAAQKYFAKSAKSLSVIQSALLAGLLKAPSKLNPLRNKKSAVKRAKQVLSNMVRAGYISQKIANLEGKKRLFLSKQKGSQKRGRYFVDWIVQQITGYIGHVTSDIRVKTTLDIDLQIMAEAKLKWFLDSFGKVSKISQGALLILSPEGEIKALVGGKNYSKSQFNRVTQARRQPGSAFKPIIYLAGFEEGLNPDSRFFDKPIKIGNWRPRNYGGKYRGNISLSEATAVSSNSVAVQIAEKVGVKKIISMAKRLGITSPLRPDLGIALGASEVTLFDLTSAYLPFSNGGKGVWPYGIIEITGRSGKVLYRRTGSGVGNVISGEHVGYINKILAGVIKKGTGKLANFNRIAAGKTGTSQEFRDAWFIGYTGNFVAGVWLGNDNGLPMKGVTGGNLPARLWKAVMVESHKNVQQRTLPGLNTLDAEATKSLDNQEIGLWDALLKALGVDR